MLNEMIRHGFVCPVCGRLTFFHQHPLYWCPYCGSSTSNSKVINTISLPRLTKRDANGNAQYIGEFGFYPESYGPQLSTTAVIEILERLCYYEEIREEKNNGD
jgi:hypothetical protein